MNNLTIEISAEQFERIEDPDRKLNIIYSALLVQQQHCKNDCEDRFKETENKVHKLEHRKKLDTGVSGIFGAIFGFIGGYLRSFFGG